MRCYSLFTVRRPGGWLVQPQPLFSHPANGKALAFWCNPCYNSSIRGKEREHKTRKKAMTKLIDTVRDIKPNYFGEFCTQLGELAGLPVIPVGTIAWETLQRFVGEALDCLDLWQVQSLASVYSRK